MPNPYEYRKKPVVVEAFQMTFSRRWDNSDWPSWAHQAWNEDGGEGSINIDNDDPERELLWVGTTSGVQRISWDDWIIRSPLGDLYACSPEVFEASYEKVDLK